MQDPHNIIALAPKSNGTQKRKCPQCSSTRKNKHDRSLSITREGAKILWLCHHCGCKGAHNGSERRRDSVGHTQKDQHRDTQRSRMRKRLGNVLW